MSLVPFNQETVLNFIPSRNQLQLKEIYSQIPQKLVTFLKKRDIVRTVDFDRKIQISDESIGNEYNKEWKSFIHHVHRSIKEVFQEKDVTCIDSYELAKDISDRYINLQPKWVKRNGGCGASFPFSKTYTIHDGDMQISRADVDVIAYVEEECEDNWFATNMYHVSYNIKLTIKALSVDGHRIKTLGQLLDQDGTSHAIEYIRSNS